MKYRTLNRVKDPLSLLGFGLMRLPMNGDKIDYDESAKMVDYAIKNGINYFDTAYNYIEGESEIFAGEVLVKNYKRDSFKLATKLPTFLLNSESDVEKYFEEQLKKLQTDYIDFYLVHALNGPRFPLLSQFKVCEYLQKQKEAGRIKHLGFSFHDKADVLRDILDYWDWDFCQIQFNYLDAAIDDAIELYKLIEAKNISAIIMEPVRGGYLAELPTRAASILEAAKPERSMASWALRYVASFPNNHVILSGMSTMEQLKDNIDTLSTFESFPDDERAALDKAVAALNDGTSVPCTGCRYCMDCPSGVDIPGMFQLYNRFVDFGEDFRVKHNYLNLVPDSTKPYNCVECGVCVPNCPQHIDIPAMLKKVNGVFAEFKL